MPVLPFGPPSVDVLSATAAGVPQSARTGREYGAVQAEALGQVGGALQGLGSSLVSYGAKKQAIDDNYAVASSVANNSFQQKNNETIMNTSDPTGRQLPGEMSTNFDVYAKKVMDDLTKSGASPAALKERALKLAEEKKQVLDNTAITSTKMAEVAGNRAIDTGNTTLLNDIAIHGVVAQKDFEIAVKKQEDAIMAQPGPDQNAKLQAVKDMRNKAATVRFNTLLFPQGGGLTKEGVAAIQKDLNDPYWAAQLEPTPLAQLQSAISASAAAFGEISHKSQTDPKINRVAGDPSVYEAELANLLGIDVSGLSGVKIAADKIDDVSDMTRVRFEALGEQAVTGGDQLMETGKAKTKAEAEVQINALIKDLNTNPVWQERLTREQYVAAQNSLQTRKNALDADWNRIQNATIAEGHRLEDKLQADVAASSTSFISRMEKGGMLPDGEFSAWQDKLTKLGRENLTAVQLNEVNKVEAWQRLFARLPEHYTQKDVEALKVEAATGGKGTGVAHSPIPASTGSGGVAVSGRGPAMRSVPAGTKPLSENDPRLAPVKTADGRTFMIDAAHQAQLQGFIHDYEAAGGVIGPNSGTVADRPGNASLHPIGGAIDINQIHRGQRAGGKTLPLDVEDKIAAKWGMRSGNHFSNNDNGHFDFGGAGGSGAGTGAGANYAKRNNPGNLRVTSFTRGQAGFVREEGGFAVFDTVEHGFQAMNSLLDSYAASGQNTISSIITKWAPPSENDTASYIATVAKKLGIDPNQTLTADDRAKLVRAMTEVEQGHSVDGSVDVSGGGTSGPSRADLILSPKTDTQIYTQQALDIAEKTLSDGLKNNTIEFGAQQLGLSVVTLDVNSKESFDKRADLYGRIDKANGGLASDQQHPLEAVDVGMLGGELNSNDSQKMNKAWGLIATWPAKMQEAAWKQLEQTTPFGAAAGRVYASGRPDIANLAIRGRAVQDSLKADGVTPTWMEESNKWFAGLGPMLAGMTTPTKGAGVKQVIDAVHMARHPSETFDAAQYQKDAEDVLGVKFDTVHGASVAIIPGTTGKQWEDALPALDLTAVSYTQTPALAVDPVKLITDPEHSLLPVNSVAVDNAVPVRMSEGLYAFMDTDENFFQTITHEKTTDYPNGKPQIYLAQLTAQIIYDAAAKAHQEAVTPDQQSIMKTYETGMGAPAGPDANLGVPPPAPPAPPAPTSAPSLTTGVPGEPPGVPSSNVDQSAPKVITPTQEKNLQSAADDYIDILSRNASLDKQYLEAARKHFVDNQRAYYLGQPSQ